MFTQNSQTPQTIPDLSARIAANLGLGPGRLYSVDFDDLFVSEEVLKVLQQLADAAASGSSSPLSGPTFSAFWVEESLELVICASADHSMQMLRVPQSHWSLRPAVCH